MALREESFMGEPKIAQKAAYVKYEKPGDISWCACGYSKNQPYCDGSHQGTEFEPMKVTIDKEDYVAWCGCKHSSSKPYCDCVNCKH